ncbi:hypothetical protein AB4122_02680 [Vibrio cyclitrophicus]
MAEYDEKNREKYDKNTEKIQSALDAIRQDKSLKVTIAQVVSLTGLHRNSLSRQGARGWVGVELEIIRQLRQEDLARGKITSKQKEDNLQNLLDQSKLEILHWFTCYSESERELDKLRNRLKRDTQSLEWYKLELKKERQVQEVLKERIELLESLVGKNGA